MPPAPATPRVARRTGSADHDRHDDPAVAPAPAPHRDAVAGAGRVAVTAAAVDLGAAVAGDRVVDGEDDRLIRGHVREDRAGQRPAGRPRRPSGARQHPVVAAEVAAGEGSHRPQHRRHRPAPGRDDRAEDQQHDALESGSGKTLQTTTRAAAPTPRGRATYRTPFRSLEFSDGELREESALLSTADRVAQNCKSRDQTARGSPSDNSRRRHRQRAAVEDQQPGCGHLGRVGDVDPAGGVEHERASERAAA